MPKKKLKLTKKTEEDELDEEDVIEGGPNDGDILEEEDELDDQDTDDEDDEDDDDLEVVRVGGQEFQVDKELANALRKRDTETAEEIRRYQSQQPQQPATNKGGNNDEDELEQVLESLGTELFTDPKNALKQLLGIAEERATTKLTAQYQKAENAKSFWNEFYDRHKDLKSARVLVENVLTSNFNKWEHLPIEEVYDRVADTTREEIAKISGTKPKRGKMRSESLENGGSTEKNKKPKKGKEKPENAEDEDENKVVTLGDILTRRRKKLHGAVANRSVVA